MGVAKLEILNKCLKKKLLLCLIKIKKNLQVEHSFSGNILVKTVVVKILRYYGKI